MSRPAPEVVRGSGPLDGLELHVSPLAGSRLVDDYQIGHPALAPFFAGHPYDIEAYRRKAAEVEQRLDATARARLTDALRPTTPRAADRLRQVLDGNGFFVTTGQQAGLFGGPLYTVYKVLSAVRLADALERALGRVVVPVFWVGADDHDFEEVAHIVALDGADALHRIEVSRPVDAAEVPMAQQPLGSDVVTALDAFTATLPDGPYADDVRARLRAHYRPGRMVADAFEASMAELLAPFDVVIVSSAHPALKRAAAPLLRTEFDAQQAHAELLAHTGAALERAGYSVQVPIADDASNVFHVDEGGRDRLVREDGTWHHRRSRRRIGNEALHTLLEEEPEAFSPNVLLRPVVESALLPTLAYVAGPGELAYFAQIGCLFRAHGIQPPLVFPRHSVTLVGPTVRRLLDRQGLAVASFRRDVSTLVHEALRDEVPEAVSDALRELRAAIDVRFERLAHTALPIDVTLTGPMDGARRSAQGSVDAIEKKILARLRERESTVARQIERIAAHLRPLGAPQERQLNIFTFLARYGGTLPHAVAHAMQVTLDTPAPDWSGITGCG